MRGWDGAGWGWGGAGLKSVNPSPPHHLYGAGKTRTGRSGEGRVKRGGAKLPSLPHMELALANDPNITIITCKNERNQLKKKKTRKKKMFMHKVLTCFYKMKTMNYIEISIFNHGIYWGKAV